jgi:hypothetical protein
MNDSQKEKYDILIVMVYATINEVWGNQLIVENPIKNMANFDSFHDRFKNNSIEQNNRKRYNDSIRTNRDNMSEDLNTIDSISENDMNIIRNYNKKKIKKDESDLEIEKIIGKKMRVKPIKKVTENFHTYNCENILEHIKHCESCKNTIDTNYKNDFLREFVIFASSGVLMFIFLELLVKIAKK